MFLILDRWQQRRRLEDYRAAVGPTVLANLHRKPHSKATEPADFFPFLRAESTLNDKSEQTPEQQLAMFRHIMGGRIREELPAPEVQVLDIDSLS